MLLIKYFIFFVFLLFFLQTGAQPWSTDIDSIIQLITPDSYRSHFDFIHAQPGSSRKVTENNVQSDDHDGCRNYIFGQLREYLGEENVYLQTFDEGDYRGLANVIGLKRGNNGGKGIIIVSAHYDSNNHREDIESGCSPGANDNGTGISAIIEIARVMAHIDTECSILFAAWDFEEQYTRGYPSGSNRWYTDCTFKMKDQRRNDKRHEGKIVRERIIANINFDMFGHPGDTIDGKPVLWVCSGNFLHKKFIDEYVSTFNQYISSVKAINKGEMDYSDHFTFAARKIPSVENLESEYSDDPYYHTCSDNLSNPKNINFEFATEVTRGGLAFLLGKAELKAKNEISPVMAPIPFALKELNDGYTLMLSSDDLIVAIHDRHGFSIPYFNEGSFIRFSPGETGLYRVSVFDSKKTTSRIYLLQKKEGQTVPFF